ncbi:MAG TPA: hypothetical protein VN577_11405 [Terriglobales bacterium]|nr:hypothetical protein [Terriglobales bacterium]
MNTAVSAVAKQDSIQSILLVDVHTHTRASRAQTMRNLGATVDCAPSAVSAISQFASGLYRLVLIDLGSDVPGAEQLASDIRLKRPKQLIGFLVGGPKFIVKTLTHKSVLPVSTRPDPEEQDASDFGRKIREAERLRN